MNLYLLMACTSSMCLSWNYPILAKIPAVEVDYKQSREVIAQTPSIPLGTLEEQLTPPPLPNTLPTPNPSPLLIPKKSPISPQIDPAVSTRIKVKRVEVEGSTVFSSKELANAVSSFVGQELTYEELLEIRTAISQLYISKGYETSGAFLPPQDIYKGVIKVQVVEGELERIDIYGLKRLRPSYVRSRLRLAGSAPLNVHQRAYLAVGGVQNEC